MKDDLLLLVEEIEKLISEAENKNSILEKRPSDIEQITDYKEKRKQLETLKVLDGIYVLPLRELANRINMHQGNMKEEFKGLEKLSIKERTLTIRNFLLSKGCNIEVILEAVPKTVEEVKTLMYASYQGFYLGFLSHQTVNNQERLLRAKAYLESLNKSDEHSDYGKAK